MGSNGFFLKNFSVLREAGARVIKGAAGAVAIFFSMALAIFAFINDYLKDHVNNFQMAMPEKAILDTLYLRKGLTAADEMETEHLDGERLRQAAQRYPMAVQRRLAALWDTNPF